MSFPSPISSLVPGDPVAAELRALRAELAAFAKAQGRPARPSKALLSLRAAAAVLGVSRGRTLRVAIDRGLVHATLINGRGRISRTEIDRILTEGLDLRAAVARKPRGKTAYRPSSPKDVAAEIRALNF